MVKTNLRWEVKKLQRAGNSSSRIAKQVQHRLKRAHAGKLHPGRSSAKIQSLAQETVRKQRYHLTKQLHQAMKKAKSFLLRKQMRRANDGGKAKDGGKAEGGGEGGGDRLLVLKALPLHEVARAALSSLGMDEEAEQAHKDDEAELREWRPLQARFPALCERTERQLLAAAAVAQQMEKLREHASWLKLAWLRNAWTETRPAPAAAWEGGPKPLGPTARGAEACVWCQQKGGTAAPPGLGPHAHVHVHVRVRVRREVFPWLLPPWGSSLGGLASSSR